MALPQRATAIKFFEDAPAAAPTTTKKSGALKKSLFTPVARKALGAPTTTKRVAFGDIKNGNTAVGDKARDGAKSALKPSATPGRTLTFATPAKSQLRAPLSDAKSAIKALSQRAEVPKAAPAEVPKAAPAPAEAPKAAPAPPKPAEIPKAEPAPKVPRVILGPEDVTAEMRAGSSCAYGGWRDDYEPIEHAAGRLHDNDELIATLDAIDEPNLVKDFEIPKFDSDDRPPPSDLELMEMRYKDDDLLEQLEEKALRDLDVRTFEPPKLEAFLFRTGPLPGDDGPGAVVFDAELCDPEMLPRPGAA